MFRSGDFDKTPDHLELDLLSRMDLLLLLQTWTLGEMSVMREKMSLFVCFVSGEGRGIRAFSLRKWASIPRDRWYTWVWSFFSSDIVQRTTIGLAYRRPQSIGFLCINLEGNIMHVFFGCITKFCDRRASRFEYFILGFWITFAAIHIDLYCMHTRETYEIYSAIKNKRKYNLQFSAVHVLWVWFVELFFVRDACLWVPDPLGDRINSNARK